MTFPNIKSSVITRSSYFFRFLFTGIALLLVKCRHGISGANAVYNVEMQTENTGELPKRSRYYQAVIDINLIKRGEDYAALKKSYVIFIINTFYFNHILLQVLRHFLRQLAFYCLPVNLVYQLCQFPN